MKGDVDDQEMICGESFDHDLEFLGEADGERSYECIVCGAEIIEETDE